jgi:hypothetical protein
VFFLPGQYQLHIYLLDRMGGKKLVALGTIQKTDRKAKARDGQPLADYIEVFVPYHGLSKISDP